MAAHCYLVLLSGSSMGKADLQQFDPTLHRQQLNDVRIFLVNFCISALQLA